MTRQQLANRRARRRTELRRRRRRAAVSAVVPAIVVALLLATLWVVLGNSDEGAGGLTAPEIPIGPGDRPKDLPIARAGLVELRLPIDQTRITAIAFHASDNPTSVELQPVGDLEYHTSPRNGRPGPERAAVDVGAPAGTLVYSPVDAVVVGVSPWVLRGRVQGYQVSVEPQNAGDVLVVLTHIGAHDGSAMPTVGQAVRAGQTPLGEVLDLSGVVDQELSRYTADAGNHVAIEVVRTGLD
ncbi:MAG: hypothetical protein IT200_15165 [Thermoleophilia bacterium]|nr:hypothetical protein [Thermoleophilia bacterium]